MRLVPAGARRVLTARLRNGMLAQGGGMSAEEMSGAHLCLPGTRGAEIVNDSRFGDEDIHPAELPGHATRRVAVNPFRLPGLVVHDVGAPLVLVGHHRVSARDASPLVDRGYCPVFAEDRARPGERFIIERDDLRRDSRRPEPGMKFLCKGKALAVHVLASHRRFLGDSPGGSVADPNIPIANRRSGGNRYRENCHDNLCPHVIHAAL